MARFKSCRLVHKDGSVTPIMDTDLSELTDEFMAACQTAGGNLVDSEVRQEYINLLAAYKVATNDFTLRRLS